ncbi:hypothetical protein AMTRI_Chr02g215600 [Amborella trichopoda]
MTLNLCVLTPNRIIWDSEWPNWCITKSHTYCNGYRYRYSQNTPPGAMVNNGSDGWFRRIGNNEITILVNDVEKGSDIDGNSCVQNAYTEVGDAKKNLKFKLQFYYH